MAISLCRLLFVVISFSFVTGYAFAQGKAIESVPAIQISPELDLGVDSSTLGTVESENEYTSKPVGSRKRWDLDSGYFGADERQSGVRPTGEDTGDYSGIRLRRPRQQ